MNRAGKKKRGGKKKPTTPAVPRRSPIQVLGRPDRTSVIRRELVYSVWYGRRQQTTVKRSLLTSAVKVMLCRGVILVYC